MKEQSTLGSATEPEAPTPPVLDLIGSAWGLLANVSEGDWKKQTEEWQEAVVRWRERYHELLSSIFTEAERTP